MNRHLTNEIIVTNVGLQAQWCDSGRRFSQQDGYSQSGAVDWFNHQLANALCANDLNAPSIEIMGGYFSFIVSSECLICITGAKADIKVNNHLRKINQLLCLKAGDEVKIGQLEEGLFNYVSFAATCKLPKFKDSVCAVKREHTGGLKGDGSSLVIEDKIEFTNVKRFKDEHLRGLYENGYFEWPLAPIIQNLVKHQLSNNKQLPILFSYQYADFTNLEKRRLLGHNYTISSKLDKMGVRLNGPSIKSQSPVLTSQPMANGAIQIPGNGRPIVMRNNRQTIGGYPVIGVVNSVGLAILSQCVEKQNISFTLTNIESSNISKSFIDLQLNQVLNKLRSFISISH